MIRELYHLPIETASLSRSRLNAFVGGMRVWDGPRAPGEFVVIGYNIPLQMKSGVCKLPKIYTETQICKCTRHRSKNNTSRAHSPRLCNHLHEPNVPSILRVSKSVDIKTASTMQSWCIPGFTVFRIKLFKKSARCTCSLAFLKDHFLQITNMYTIRQFKCRDFICNGM